MPVPVPVPVPVSQFLLTTLFKLCFEQVWDWGKPLDLRYFLIAHPDLVFCLLKEHDWVGWFAFALHTSPPYNIRWARKCSRTKLLSILIRKMSTTCIVGKDNHTRKIVLSYTAFVFCTQVWSVLVCQIYIVKFALWFTSLSVIIVSRNSLIFSL